MSRKCLWSAAVAVLTAVVSGCSSPMPESDPVPPPPPPAPKAEPPTPPRPLVYAPVRLDVPINLSLADLLARPRQELAQLADELVEQIQLQQQKHHHGEMPFTLLPDFRLPLAVPVFRAARYSARRRVSLPPYLAEAAHDNAVAGHLARFGDVDGALQVADPADARVAARIKACRCKRNYPVEWTRLVALHLHTAQIRLATGSPQGARQLIGLHRQLRKLLDRKARAGRLGATLLARGRGVLTQAVAAWRKGNRNDLAVQVEAVLADWGKVPVLPAPVSPGSERAEVVRFLGGHGEGQVLATPTARAFDLLALPLPAEEADAVLACFDGANQLAEVMVVYRPGLTETYPSPGQLAQLLEDSCGPGLDLPDAGRLRRRAYKMGKLTWDITVVPDHTAAGALVRLGTGKPPANPPALGRAFGGVDFDRPFEHNRAQFAPNQRGSKLTADDPEDFDRTANPLQALRVAGATLEGEVSQNVVTRLRLSYTVGRRGLPALARIVLPLWERGGPPHLVEGSDDGSHSLCLVWQDQRTRCTLRLYHARGHGPVFEITDRTPAQDLARRAAQVAAHERALRQARLKANKPLRRLKRAWEEVGLGMSRPDVLNALPDGEGIVRREVPDGLGVVFKGGRENSPGYLARDLFVRFGPDQRVAEVRLRYTDDPAAKQRNGVARLLAELTARSGAPEQRPGPWAVVWTDFPRRQPAPVLSRWQDDVTLLTCQRDSEGLELVVRDCPPEYPDGVPLKPFRCLPAGPDDCRLGDDRAALLKSWKVTRPRYLAGALILPAPSDSPYDHLQVRFDGQGQVVQITARHRPQGAGQRGPDQLAQAVRVAWAKQMRQLGWPRREDYNVRKQMQSWTSHDELTRVSIFWQERKGAAGQLFTEWKRVSSPPR